MTSKAAILALLSLWGVGATTSLPVRAEETTPSEQSESKDGREAGLTDRVWVQAGTDLPGVVKIFLSDGTLVQDSCWETHRMSAWQQISATEVRWNEDGIDVKADIVTLTANELVLKIAGVGEQRYAPSPVPAVCPDTPKA